MPPTATRRLIGCLLTLIVGSAPCIAFSADGAAEKAATGRIVEVGYGYGNLQTDIPASATSVELGSPFTFSCKGKSFTATWVSWYSDVGEGEWLGLEGEGGKVQLAVSFGDANAESGCGEGDEVRVE